MPKEIKRWKKGRGKLGPLVPLTGKWKAEGTSPMGPMTCLRAFEPILAGTRIRLEATWKFQALAYNELAIFGPDAEGVLVFHSYTSDGKSSNGQLADATDIHPEAIGFEAQMPAGFARMVYWPDDDGEGFHWAVESKTKKGWNRFTIHHYRPDGADASGPAP